jgi:hypothetical protein
MVLFRFNLTKSTDCSLDNSYDDRIHYNHKKNNEKSRN